MTTRLLILALALLPVVSAAQPSHEERRQVMGTMAVVAAWCEDPGQGETVVDEAFAVFARVDSLMSTWRDDSVLASLNRAPANTWVEVGGEVAVVLAEAQAAAEASGGAYDPTVLPLVRLWGFRGGEPAIPDADDLAAILPLVDHGLLEVDLESGRARLGRAGMEIDLGGIAKGYALDAAAEAMREAGARGGMLDLGGNVLVFGEGPDREVGVRDPAGPGLLAALPLDDGSAATSGQYERFVVIGGEKFGHVLDPRTGRPIPGGAAVTVLAESAMRADALATAALVLGPRRGLAFLDSLPGVEALFVVAGTGGEPSFLVTSGLDEAR